MTTRSANAFANAPGHSLRVERMRRLTFRPAALADLESILEFIARDNLTRALTFTEELHQQCHKLAAFPGTIGRLRTELRPDIRSYAYRGYVIFYRTTEDEVGIVNVFEGHRDVIAHFQNDSFE